MTITKAIEILTDLTTTLPQFSPDDKRDAVKLGIAALKRFQQARSYGQSGYFSRLPGED